MNWINEPPEWREENGVLAVRTGPDSDFWRVTHYGFVRDTGHFYCQPITGNFAADVKVIGRYNHLYDQAGLMLRIDERNWIKCGIEFVDGVQQASAVVTRDYSDWSVVPLASRPESIHLRVTRKGDAVRIDYSLDGVGYSMLRMAYLPPVDSLLVGPMCASPDGPGFGVRFEEFRLRPL